MDALPSSVKHPVAGPSRSVTETLPGIKAPMKSKRSSKMTSKILTAIRAIGDESGAPLGGIKKYLVDHELISPQAADWKVLKAASEAVKKGIVTMGTASDFNWLFRLANRQKNTPSKRAKRSKSRSSRSFRRRQSRNRRLSRRRSRVSRRRRSSRKLKRQRARRKFRKRR